MGEKEPWNELGDWERIGMNNIPGEFRERYEFKSIRIGDNEKIFFRKRDPNKWSLNQYGRG